jgi:hypothetical protein
VAVYNAYDHSLETGLPLPAPRASVMLAIGTYAYMFGGFDSSGAPTATVWRFDSTIAPAGAFFDYGSRDGFARAGELMLPIGNEHFLVTGVPPAELYGLDGSVVERQAPPLPAAGATLTANDGVSTVIFAGADGVVRFRGGTFTTLPIAEAARAGASVVEVPGGKAAVLCGSTDAVRIDAASGAAEVFPGVPSQAKTGCAIAATSRYVLIAGGSLVAGGIDPIVEIYDASTFALVATAPLVVPRTGAFAVALPNDQILIASGVDATGAPTGTIELYTPAN